MKKYLLTTIVAILILFCVAAYFIKKGIKNFSVAFKESNGISYEISYEYLGLFSKPARRHFSNYLTNLSKIRNPVSSLVYDSLYCVVVYKINLQKEKQPGKLITQDKRGNVDHSKSVYAVDKESLFELEVKTGDSSLVKNISVQFPDSVKSLVNNDSTLYYYTDKGGFFLKYNNNNEADIFTNFKEASILQQDVPVSLLFLIRSNAVYLIIMSVEKNGVVLPKNLLYELVYSPV